MSRTSSCFDIEKGWPGPLRVAIENGVIHDLSYEDARWERRQQRSIAMKLSFATTDISCRLIPRDGNAALREGAATNAAIIALQQVESCYMRAHVCRIG
ncbi:hypothetical protein BKD09_41935 [Bradyrhizobium japonicum]|uniref:Uncharacterized protein n=1 Tax=Bradyrhizobium japonicum TaxID=375 RepID=A0A1L3FNN2_BRAJP|nr:hypothetical protein BKD09_41935 [Bradyrhizobium japonicum]